MYKLMVILHLLGAATWVGGHIALVRGVLPGALRDQDPEPVVRFERSFGKAALFALVVQLATGLVLANSWVGSWSTILTEPTPAARTLLLKLVVLALSLAVGGHAYHRIVPRLTKHNLNAFAWHARILTLLAVALLALGASIRLGGLF